ncbi:hypothetical protein GUJ93_ZPchr0362g5, partial [Zizania palustris]
LRLELPRPPLLLLNELRALALLLHRCILALYPRTRSSGQGSEKARSAPSDAPFRRPAARRCIRPHRLHALRHLRGFLAGVRERGVQAHGEVFDERTGAETMVEQVFACWKW